MGKHQTYCMIEYLTSGETRLVANMDTLNQSISSIHISTPYYWACNNCFFPANPIYTRECVICQQTDIKRSPRFVSLQQKDETLHTTIKPRSLHPREKN